MDLDGVEFDVKTIIILYLFSNFYKVWFTKDKVLVVCHGISVYGNTLARPLDCAEGTKYDVINIKDTLYEELVKYELKDTKTIIPTLKECFEVLKKRPLPFVYNVEVKETDVGVIKAVLDLGSEMGILD
jgi:glycerophosphoryl diester phosphodiesterase